jgi:hypothetical protein
MTNDGSAGDPGEAALAALDAGQDLDQTEMDAAAPLATARFIDIMHQMEGVSLNVDRAGLEWLDAFLVALRTDPLADDPDELHALFGDAACFVGECLVNDAGAWWGFLGQPLVFISTKAGPRLFMTRGLVENAFNGSTERSLVQVLDDAVAESARAAAKQGL